MKSQERLIRTTKHCKHSKQIQITTKVKRQQKKVFGRLHTLKTSNEVSVACKCLPDNCFLALARKFFAFTCISLMLGISLLSNEWRVCVVVSVFAVRESADVLLMFKCSSFSLLFKSVFKLERYFVCFFIVFEFLDYKFNFKAKLFYNGGLLFYQMTGRFWF